MSYAPLGQTYDRRQPNPGSYPGCATEVEKTAARAACRPTVISGLGAALGAVLAGTRFEGANPCWVDQLPTCPTCLSYPDLSLFGNVIRGQVTGTDASNAAHLAALYACPEVQPPPMPTCITHTSRPQVDYCKQYPSYNGPNRDANAACWKLTRYKYGGINGGYWSVLKTKPNCPDCITTPEALAFADCVSKGHAGKSGPGIAPYCADPRMGWPLCAGEQLPPIPDCAPQADYDLVQYCKQTSGPDHMKNAACYLMQRSPEFWRAVSAIQVCPPPQPPSPPEPTLPKCVKRKKCWDGSKVCVTRRRADGTKGPTGRRCPDRPVPIPGLTDAPPPPPEKKGLSTGSILLIAAVVGGGAYYLSQRKKKAA